MPLPSNMIKAIYRDTGIAKYKGNPLIETLPPIMSLKKVKEIMTGKIEINPEDIYTEGRRRSHVIASLLDDFFQPLSSHLQLEEKISIMIRRGYVGRNLADGSLNTHMQNGYERLMTGDLEAFRFEHAKSTATSLSLIGCSGSGKSSTINRILSSYPQVIYHEKYNFTQISYLKVDCPHDGSLYNLCIQFYRALDKELHLDYEKKYTKKRFSVDTLLSKMSQDANQHAIGVLIIDEIQHLNRKRSGGAELMLNFFVTLVNVIGLPVILVGTPKAREIFEKDLRSARRGAGFGALFWEPIKKKKPEKDQVTGKLLKTEWVAFTNILWKYQWLNKRDEILTEDIRDAWYDLSQGVLDIVVKLFVLAQLRAIAIKTERITEAILKKVYDDELKPVHPMLEALRSGDPDKISNYSDLVVPDIDMKILKLRESIEKKVLSDESDIETFNGDEQAIRLYNLLLAMNCESKLLKPLVTQAIEKYPKYTIKEFI